MTRRHRSLLAAGLICCAGSAGPSQSDVGAFISVVEFDGAANLETAPGFGLRWGRSSGTLGGETSLMFSRPDRKVATGLFSTNEPATAIFYEGRLFLNLPAGTVRPFLSAGYGAITILPGDLESSLASEDDRQVLAALSEIETSQAFSYGVGARWSLDDRLDIRLDLRQYQVFSVTGAVVERVAGEAAGVLVQRQGRVTNEELSAGILFRL